MIARVTLPSGRTVLDTGKVMIGLLHEPRHVEEGSQALLIQRLLTTRVPREWHTAPRVIRLRRSLWQRLRDWWLEGKS
jgi:hypothetical protein